ncbi:Serine/threonine-protein phosphatase 7 long form homolog, partial [Linum perenne]
SKKIVDYDPRYAYNYLALTGLPEITEVVSLVPDLDLITTLVERWRLGANIFHLYNGEATITHEDVQFITGLSRDGRLIDGGD